MLPFNLKGLANTGALVANEQLALTTIHMLLVREHNRLAQQIKLDNPRRNISIR
jgi:hypothetical protein